MEASRAPLSKGGRTLLHQKQDHADLPLSWLLGFAVKVAAARRRGKEEESTPGRRRARCSLRACDQSPPPSSRRGSHMLLADRAKPSGGIPCGSTAPSSASSERGRRRHPRRRCSHRSLPKRSRHRASHGNRFVTWKAAIHSWRRPPQFGQRSLGRPPAILRSPSFRGSGPRRQPSVLCSPSSQRRSH